jgi:methylenetetrahydrofolate dehydrogenase (NADP+)/methenyltetrahydrofolate cyclohydrolase
MTAKLLEGAPLAEKINAETKKKAEDFAAKKGRPPKLVAVQVGTADPGTKFYVKGQKKSAEAAGVNHELAEMPADISEEQLLARIREMNSDDGVDGILLLVPLPEHIDARRVQVEIAPDRDVEGMHPENLGKLFYGNQVVAPCTAMSALELIRSTGLDLSGKEVVILGHSEIIGKPLAMLLLQSLNDSATVTVAHVATSKANMRDFHTGRAEILVSAMGYKPRVITADIVKEGAVVIDVATMQEPALDEQGNPLLTKKGKPKKRQIGDVDFEPVLEKAGYLSPVPGGVGTVTSTILMRNCVDLAAARL